MLQTKLASFTEAIVNTIVGFILSLYLIWPLATLITGIQYNSMQQYGVVAIFTIWSVLRGYFLRRVFNRFNEVVSRFCLGFWCVMFHWDIIYTPEYEYYSCKCNICGREWDSE